MPRWRIALAALLTSLAAFFGAAAAQDYPTRPITLIVPFPPGGSNTIVARIVAEKMSETLGRQIVVDNRGGAGGTLGARTVATSAPDGYTLLFGFTGTMAMAPNIYPNPGYDPRRDFIPIGRIGTAPTMLVVHPSFAVNSVADLIKLAKESPGKINYGSAGIGTVGHMAMELLQHMAGIKLTHVPYKGTGPAMSDLIGGHIPIMFSPVPAAHGNVKSGTLRALAVSTATRSKVLPELPTIAESGLPGYEAALRYGLLAPAGTPRPIVDKLNRELRAAMTSEDVIKRLAIDGADPLPSTSEQYAADIDREEATWAKIVKAIGLKAETQ
jgi:tripartite-type tricarboxylate transporter receptor subunit TctC